jgi:receptor expression-enhancing protein 5/6
MEAFQAKLKYYNAQADKELSKYPQIIKLEQQVGVPKTYLAAGVVGFVSFLIFFDVWGQLLSNLIGWLYPGIMLRETLYEYCANVLRGKSIK